MLPDIIALQIENDADRLFLEDLYNEEYNKLYKYAMNIVKNSDTAHDLVQTLFLEMISYIPRLRTVKNISAYLRVSLEHIVYRYLKAQQKVSFSNYEEFLEKYSNLPHATESVEDIVIKRERDLEIRSLILQMNALQRKFLILYYYLDLNIKEISQVLSITPEYANVIHKRIRDKLGKCFQRGQYFEF